jgi:voltage-gated potassium channel
LTPESAAKPKFSNSYELFILLLTILSLLDMVLLIVPWMAPPTVRLLQIYDFVMCLVFLLDFGLRMKRASSWRTYFFRERGWLDLLGSIPSLGISRYGALLRLARLSRLVRVLRLFRSQGQG